MGKEEVYKARSEKLEKSSKLLISQVELLQAQINLSDALIVELRKQVKLQDEIIGDYTVTRMRLHLKMGKMERRLAEINNAVILGDFKEVEMLALRKI